MGRRGIDWARACVVMLLLGAAGADEVRGSPPPQADKIVVVKHQRRLVLEKDGVVLREYRVALGHNPVGHKIAECYRTLKHRVGRDMVGLDGTLRDTADCLVLRDNPATATADGAILE